MAFFEEFHEKTAGEIGSHKDAAQQSRRPPFAQPSFKKQQPDKYQKAEACLIELAWVPAIPSPVMKSYEAHAPGQIGDAAHDLAVQEVADPNQGGDKGRHKGIAVQYEVEGDFLSMGVKEDRCKDPDRSPMAR